MNPCPWCGRPTAELIARTCKSCQPLERPIKASTDEHALPPGRWVNDRGVQRFERAA